MQLDAVAAGYKGGRGSLSMGQAVTGTLTTNSGPAAMETNVCGVYGYGVNVQNITSLGTTGFGGQIRWRRSRHRWGSPCQQGQGVGGAVWIGSASTGDGRTGTDDDGSGLGAGRIDRGGRDRDNEHGEWWITWQASLRWQGRHFIRQRDRVRRWTCARHRDRQRCWRDRTRAQPIEWTWRSEPSADGRLGCWRISDAVEQTRRGQRRRSLHDGIGGGSCGRERISFSGRGGGIWKVDGGDSAAAVCVYGAVGHTPRRGSYR